jgi:hypothetical protein
MWAIMIVSTKYMVAAVSVAGIVAGSATAAPAPAPVTTEQFVERCKTDAEFCKIQIMAAEALLEKSRKACLPANVSKDAMATRVQDVVGDVLEEDPDTFKSGPYRQIVDQIIAYLWPCEPIS